MTAAVPLIAEALNLAITEHWGQLARLEIYHSNAEWCRDHPDVEVLGSDRYGEEFSAGVEALAVALHARLQEQGALG